MAWYRSGTLSVTNGSTSVTGAGTSWIAGAGIGEALYTPDGRIYEIANIASNTSLTLATAYLGATQSGQSYTIIPSQSYIRDLAADASSLISQYAGIASGAGAGKFTDGTVSTPGIAFASDVDTGIYHPATNTLGIAAGGINQMQVSTAGVNIGTLSANPVISAGTANGVTYLNGSKQLVSGSGLTFDGTNLGVGTSSPGYKLDVAGTLNVVNGSNGRINIGATSNYLYGDSTGKLIIGTSGSDKLQVDAAGNLGLGVTPSAWIGNRKTLQIGGLAVVNINYASSIGENAYNFYYNNNGSAIYQNNGPAAVFDFNNSASGGFAWKTAPSGTAGQPISFTQAMTLDASGNLLVGTTNSAYGGKLAVYSTYVAGEFRSPSGLGVLKVIGAGDSYGGGEILTVGCEGTNFNAVIFRSDLNGANTIPGSISCNATTTAYNTSSDYRLKNIAGPITTSGQYIDSLNPVEGTWKADGSTFVGLIAHEVQEASRTQVATGEKDGEQMQAMDYSNSELIANLIAEVKSLRARVAALETN